MFGFGDNPYVTIEWRLRCGGLEPGYGVIDRPVTECIRLQGLKDRVAEIWEGPQVALQRKCNLVAHRSTLCALWHVVPELRAFNATTGEMLIEPPQRDPMAGTIAELQDLETQLRRRHGAVANAELAQLATQIADARRYLLIRAAEDEKALAADTIQSARQLAELAVKRQAAYAEVDAELRDQFSVLS
jgi:hypothetical protein